MKSMKIAMFLLFTVILYGCSEIKVNMADNYTPASCPVTVIDMRPDPRIISGSDLYVFDMTPPIKEVLHAKLCNNQQIRQASESNEIIIRIRDLKYRDIPHAFSIETILIIDGSFQCNGKYYEIQTGGNINKSGGKITERLPLMFNEAAEKFVTSVVTYVK